MNEHGQWSTLNHAQHKERASQSWQENHFCEVLWKPKFEIALETKITPTNVDKNKISVKKKRFKQCYIRFRLEQYGKLLYKKF